MPTIKHLLFVCSQNKLRSATAETVFSDYERVEAIGCGTNHDAPTPVSGDLILWADVIFVMENSHRKKINQWFKELLKDKRLICLGIPDNYDYMQPELVQLLKNKVHRAIRL